MRHNMIPALLLTCPACLLDKDLGDSPIIATAYTGESAASDPIEPGATDSGESGDSGATEATTGAPNGCPEGQPPLTPLWQFEYEPPPSSFGFDSGISQLGRMSDGRIIAAGELNLSTDTSGVALVEVSPDGQFLDVQTDALGEHQSEVYSLAVDANDQPLVLAMHWSDSETGLAKLTRFASDTSLISEVELPQLGYQSSWGAPRMALAADGVVLVGSDHEVQDLVMKVDATTGAPIWQHTIAGSLNLWLQQVAVGPAGDIVVAGHDPAGGFTSDTLMLWRFDSAGTLLWERQILVPAFEAVAAVRFTPDDQVVVLRGTAEEFGASVELTSVERSTGATRWELTVAPFEDDRNAWAEDMYVDADHFTIPVARSEELHQNPSTGSSFDVRTVSLTGELLAVTPITDAIGPSQSATVRSVRGQCGELILSPLYSDLTLKAYAP